MFQIGEFIFYGLQGVCKVVDIGHPGFSGVPKDKLYYTLEPAKCPGDKIFTPVDNTKTVIRPIISKDEAMKLIDGMDELEIFEIPDERKREFYYKNAIKKCDCEELVKIIKTTYLRKKSRNAAGKKAIADDEKYFKIAEDTLYGELAVALEMDPESVKRFILERMKETEAAG